MTYRNRVEKRLPPLGVMKERAKVGLAVSLTYFLVFNLLGIVVDLSALEASPWMLVFHIPTVILFFCLYFSAKASRLLRQKEPCPQCGKDVSYLLTDRNYSHCGGWRIPLGFPDKFDKCPYCSESWDEDETQNQHLEHISDRANAV